MAIGFSASASASVGIGFGGSDAAGTPAVAPLHPFRFLVEFAAVTLSDDSIGEAVPLAAGAFAEVRGIEATMEPKLIKEGGHNYGSHQRAGTTSFATVILKRGMTGSRDLWKWFALLQGADSEGRGAYAHRLQVTITMQDHAGEPVLKWQLRRAMPVKFKAADLNARASEVAIEEIHLVHEGLQGMAP